MTLRTTRTSVTFAQPFHLKAFVQALPPGDYEVDVDEEVIEGNDRTVYRRVATGLRVPEGGRLLTYPVDADDLAEALIRDRGHHRPAAPASANEPVDAVRPISLPSVHGRKPWRFIPRWVQKLRAASGI